MVWCVVMPVTSFLIIPTVQGTIPAVIVAIPATLWVILTPRAWVPLVTTSIYLLGTYFISQVLLQMYGNVVAGDLRAVEPDVDSLLRRSSSITQGLYFIPCLIIFLFFRYHFKERYLRYVFWGAWFLMLYGFIDWAFGLVSGEEIGFMANREFEQVGKVSEGTSRAQFMSLGGIRLMRFKSFTGEPSFFALTAIPYLALAFCTGRSILALAIAGAIALSFSTSGYIGVVVIVLAISAITRRIDTRVALAFLAGLALFAMILFIYPDMYQSMFVDKYNADNTSGKERSGAYTYALEFFRDLPFLLKIVGIGFGITYLPGILRSLIDLGLIGVSIFLTLFLKPVFYLGGGALDIGLRVAILSMLAIYSLSCEEVFLPTTWMFLGIAYHQLDQMRAWQRNPMATNLQA